MAATWLERTMQRGRRADHFPHQLWFIMDNPLRRLLVNPRQLVDRLELSGSEDVLEVGPGPGLFSVELARRLTSGRLELLELQPELLARARRKLDRAGCRNVGFHVGDAGGRLPFPDACFDVAFLAAVLGEVTDQRACLRSLARVLRPGGLLAVQEFFPDPDRLRVPEIRGVAEPAGFRFIGAQGRSWNYTVRLRRRWGHAGPPG
jgi:ubiquinone/menaquinone biosynthesis C-methylase UbiE